MPDPERSACAGCGAMISFVEGPAGKLIPVQLVTNRLYVLRDALPGMDLPARLDKLELRTSQDVYVSHFATCPQARRFSRGRRR